MAGLAAGRPSQSSCLILSCAPAVGEGAPRGPVCVLRLHKQLPEYLLLLFMLPTLVQVSVSGL